MVVGEELRTHAGEIIGLFLTEHVPFGVSPREAAAAHPGPGRPRLRAPPVRPACGATCPRPALVDLVDAGLVDAIEVLNAKTSLSHLNERAAAFAAERSLPAGAGSDAHVPDALGAAYVEMPDFTDAASFLAALRDGNVVGHHFDAARPWRARIVPST